MSATANRPRAAKIKPPRIESPLESVISRIASARTLIGMAIDAAEKGDHIEMVLTGLEENLLPGALASLHGTSVTKADVDKAYCKLFFPLSVLYAAQLLSMGLVMESTLQQAFETLDRAHSDMDGALVQHWSIPEGTEEAGGTGTDDAINEDDPRLAIAREAVYEVDALLHVLRSVRQDENNFKDAFNGMSLRALDLTSVAMSALANDTGRPTDELQLIVRGDGA